MATATSVIPLCITVATEKARKPAALSNIFKGCRIVFNGRTGNVSSYYLAKLVHEHGGFVISSLMITRVTHVIGSNLNGSKADKLLKVNSNSGYVLVGDGHYNLMNNYMTQSNGKVKFVRPGTKKSR